MVYCRDHHLEQAAIFTRKLAAVSEIETFIEQHSLDEYVSLVRDYGSHKAKLFWWQDVVPLHKLQQ